MIMFYGLLHKTFICDQSENMKWLSYQRAYLTFLANVKMNSFQMFSHVERLS